MVDKTGGPTPPHPHGPHGSDSSKGPKGPQEPTSKGSSGIHYKGGQIEAKPMTFLGMYFDADQAKKLWNTIIQAINNQIQKDNDKALKALKRLKKTEQGEDPDDD